jgi:hypothetical protein
VVEEFEQHLWGGPPAASVEEVRELEADGTGAVQGFSILPTV